MKKYVTGIVITILVVSLILFIKLGASEYACYDSKMDDGFSVHTGYEIFIDWIDGKSYEEINMIAQ